MSPHRTKKSVKPIRRVLRRSGAISPRASQKIHQKQKPSLVHLSQVESFLGGYGKNWKAVFDNSQDGILIADIATGRFVKCNKMIAKMLRYSETEILSLSVKDVHPVKELKHALAGFDHMSRGQVSAVADIPMKRKDGSSFYVDISGSRLEFSGRKYLVGFFRDVTERKESKEMLIESEDMFRTFTERSPNMIFINQRGRVVYANPKCEEIMGYKRKEFYSPRFNFLSLIHPNDIPAVRLNFLTHQQGKEVAPYEYKMIAKSGKLIHGILTSKLIHYRGAPAILGIVTDISDRKKAEEVLRESEEKYKRLIETTGTGYVTLDERGRVTDANREFVRLTGRKKLAEIVGHRVQEWTAPYDRKRNKLEVKKCFERGFTRNFEIDYLTPTGQIIPVEINATMVRDSVPIRILTICRDITERKQVEKSLAQREAHISAIIENQPGMVWLKDGESRLLAVNQKFADAAGVKSPTNAIGKKDSDFWPQKLAQKYRADDKRVMKTGKSIVVEELISVGGVERWYETFKTPVRNEKGDILGTSGYAQDITERKRTEAILKESEEKFRAMFETSQSGMALCEMDGTLVQMNRAYLDIIGYTHKEAAKLTYWDLTPKEYAADEAKQLRSMAKTGRYGPYEKEYIRKTGERVPILLNGAVVIGADGKERIWSIVMDITEHKRAEEGLKRGLSLERATLESTADGILVVDHSTGKVTDFNDRFSQLWNIPNKILRSKSDEKLRKYVLSQLKDPKRFLSKITELYQHPRKESFDILEFKDGKIFERYSHPQFLDGKPVGRVWSFRDVTARKLTERALEESEKRYRTVADNTYDWESWQDPQGMYLYVSPSCKRITGYAAEDFLADKHLMEKIIFRDDRIVFTRHRESVVKRKIRAELQFRILCSDGALRWVHHVCQPVFDKKKKYLGIRSSNRDITERKLTEKALAESEKRFRSLFESSQDAMMTLEPPSWEFTSANISMVRMFKAKDAAELLSYSPWELSPKRQPDGRASGKKAMEMIQTAVRKGSNFFEWMHRRVDGTTFLAEVLLTRVEKEAGVFLQATVRDITERKRAASAVLKAQQFSQSVINSLPGIFYVFDKKGKFLQINEKFSQVTKYPLKKILEMHPLDFFNREEKTTVKDKIREVFEKGESCVEAGLLSKDGKKIPYYFTGIRTVIDDQPLLVGVGLDMIERKKAEEAVAASERRLSNLMANLPGMVYRCRNERDWPMFFVSEGCLPLTGYRQNDFESNRVLYNDLIHRDDQKRIWNAVQEAVAGKKHFEFIYRIRTKQHEEKWVWERGHGAWNDSGELMYLDGFITDITDRQRAEDFLKEHRHQLLQVIDTVPHMIFAEDGKGRFLLVNRAAAQAYGREPRDLIGVLRQDVHKVREEVKNYLEADKEILMSGKSKVIPWEFFTDVYGQRHILQTIKIPFKMVGAKEECILGVSVDVTEQKKVEDFRNEIIRTVSHELRTPLSIEKEGISLLMDEMVGPVNTQQKEILDAVMRSIDRLARMISSLLDVSSVETGKIKLFQKVADLTTLAKDIAFEFKKRASAKNIDLSAKSPERAVRVLMDSDRVMQVLSNLVDNAIKFTPEGGTVRISLAVLKNEVECEVRDTGIGIVPENIAKAFEKFQQFSRKDGPGEKGFGLGLSIAKGIIELHGGRIWIESELGKGTRATFSLPLYQGGKDRGHA